MRQLRIIVTVVFSVSCAAGTAWAHSERQIVSPIRPGPVPSVTRVNPNQLVVCKASSKPTAAQLADIQYRLATATGQALLDAQAEDAAWHRNAKLFKRCCFEHIQDAVNAASDNTDILILPGVYREEPSRARPTSASGDLPDGSYSYEYHVAHPNDANLIAVLGKNNITLEGTGWRPQEVLIDAGFVKDVGIRADRCTGFIVRNFWQKDANEHGVYTVDSDGYLYDRVIGSYSKEYELFAFASDNGLMIDCEAIGGGDSGFYIGGHPDTHTLGRYSCELRRAKMHHNALGFSGTQGNSVLITDSEVYDNAIGISFDSENDHPNFPERFAVIENNDIHDNNFDIYAPTSDVPVRGPGYDFFRYPVGTALWFIGGEDNIVRNNRMYNNQRFGVIVAGNPLEAPLPARVNRNQAYGNLMGAEAGGGAGPNCTAFPAGGDYAPGGSDFLWDETGDDNCFGPNGMATIDPNPAPGPCPAPNDHPNLAPPDKLSLLLSCQLTQVPGSNPPVYVTADTVYPCPWGQTNDGPYQSSSEAECGNGIIDVGEDCDGAIGYGGMPNLAGETCTSLGHGDGTLACDSKCQWDFGGCSVASSCHDYRVFRSRVRRMSSFPGDQRYRFIGREMEGATLTPLAEAVDVILRDDQGELVTARIPAGAPGWSAPRPRMFEYKDPSGAYGGVTGIRLWTVEDSFGNGFRADIKFNNGLDLTRMATTQTSATILRVGNDCWSQDAPCENGGIFRCKFPERQCPAGS